jgi:hypothetical protein
MIAAPVAACTASKWLVVVLKGVGGGLSERPQGSITQNGRALGARKSICYRRLVVVRYAFRRSFRTKQRRLGHPGNLPNEMKLDRIAERSKYRLESNDQSGTCTC